MRERQDERLPETPGVAWQNGHELVIFLDAPLPPICVFCGAPAVAAMRGLIKLRGSTFPPRDLARIWISLCREDRVRLSRAQIQAFIAFLVTAVVLIVTFRRTGMLPGLSTLLAIQSRGVAFVLLIVALSFAVRYLTRRLYQAYFGKARPVDLVVDHARDGHVWLRGADPRCLSQLPSVSTED